MADKLEITLRITLDRPGLQRHLRRVVENDTAFFVLGLVHAQLTSTFGDDNCTVDMEAATGVSPDLIRSMNSFARRHKRALQALEDYGEAIVDEQDVLEVLGLLHDVVITPLGGRWRVTRSTYPGDETPGVRAPQN